MKKRPLVPHAIQLWGSYFQGASNGLTLPHREVLSIPLRIRDFKLGTSTQLNIDANALLEFQTCLRSCESSKAKRFALRCFFGMADRLGEKRLWATLLYSGLRIHVPYTALREAFAHDYAAYRVWLRPMLRYAGHAKLVKPKTYGWEVQTNVQHTM